MLVSRRILFVVALGLLVTRWGFAHEGHTHVDKQLVKATKDFIKTLDKDDKAKASFKFDGPERTDWHFVPKDRVGLSIKDMDLEQRRAAHQLLRVALSNIGYLKATAIMNLEYVLAELEKDPVKRDQEKYWFAIFGTPNDHQGWGWRVEGHHLSLNFTSVNGLVVSTPLFLGANPAEIKEGPRSGLRVLGGRKTWAEDSSNRWTLRVARSRLST